METVGLVVAGLMAGWVARSTVESSRELTVRAIAKAHELADRTRRFAAIEREHFEDLMAEGRARYERDRAGRRWSGAPHVAHGVGAAKSGAANGAGNGAGNAHDRAA